MSKYKRGAIPAFLSIDVEPDGFQISREDSPKWPGYEAMCDFSTWLRKELARRSGAKAHFGWYYRMDPQMEQVYGRADVAATALPERTASLRAEGDYFGVHAHAIRWSDERQLWVHDFGDLRIPAKLTNESDDVDRVVSCGAWRSDFSAVGHHRCQFSVLESGRTTAGRPGRPAST